MSVPFRHPLIEGFWVKNFRALKSVSFGSCFQHSVVAEEPVELLPYELTATTTFFGPSGIGKNSILDVFAFLSDCLQYDLKTAVSNRGGYDDIYHCYSTGPISIGIVFREHGETKPLTYLLNINQRSGEVYFESEALVYRNSVEGGTHEPLVFFQNGEKSTRFLGKNLCDVIGRGAARIRSTDHLHLALSILGDHVELPDITSLKHHIEGFHWSCHTPFWSNYKIDTSVIQSSGAPSKKTSKWGKPVDEFRRMFYKHPQGLQPVFDAISEFMPDVERIYLERPDDWKNILMFKMKHLKAGLTADKVSDGIVRLFSHLLFLEDPIPSPFVAIEDPAASLDDKQIQVFANRLRSYTNEGGRTQFFLTGSSAACVDYLDPSEVWLMNRTEQGEVSIIRAIDELAFQGIPYETIGPYWYTDNILRESF